MALNARQFVGRSHWTRACVDDVLADAHQLIEQAVAIDGAENDFSVIFPYTPAHEPTPFHDVGRCAVRVAIRPFRPWSRFAHSVLQGDLRYQNCREPVKPTSGRPSSPAPRDIVPKICRVRHAKVR